MPTRFHRFTFSTVFILTICLAPMTRAETLTLEKVDNPNSIYCLGLLKLALSYSAKNYDLDASVNSTSQIRAVEQLNAGVTDVLWLGTSRELEQVLRPVRIPLYRGLLGYRIFLIRKGTQPKFNEVNTLADLSRFSLGQGSEWPDTTILKSNGLHVEEVLKYENLFPMLDGGRFDAFPRGVQEPWAELKAFPQLELEVEKKLMLVYHMPLYFFVARDNAGLQREIEKGLEQALADGRFEAYFFDSPLIKDVLERANLKNRKAFHLQNPMLPEATPVSRKELWFDPLES